MRKLKWVGHVPFTLAQLHVVALAGHRQPMAYMLMGLWSSYNGEQGVFVLLDAYCSLSESDKTHIHDPNSSKIEQIRNQQAWIRPPPRSRPRKPSPPPPPPPPRVRLQRVVPHRAQVLPTVADEVLQLRHGRLGSKIKDPFSALFRLISSGNEGEAGKALIFGVRLCCNSYVCQGYSFQLGRSAQIRKRDLYLWQMLIC